MKQKNQTDNPSIQKFQSQPSRGAHPGSFLSNSQRDQRLNSNEGIAGNFDSLNQVEKIHIVEESTGAGIGPTPMLTVFQSPEKTKATAIKAAYAKKKAKRHVK